MIKILMFSRSSGELRSTHGTYTIDEAAGRVSHHVEAASHPAWIGDELVRWYRFENGNLWISLNSKFDNPLLWERLPDAAGDDRSTAMAAEREDR